MHVPLTISWTTGLLVTIGALCLADPIPWFWFGIAILLVSLMILFREMQKIATRSRCPHDLSVAATDIEKLARGSYPRRSLNDRASPIQEPATE
jgi:hypothetical protein